MSALGASSSLVGTWKLISREDITADGERRIEPNLGAEPLAYLIYDTAGQFAAQFMRRNRSSVTSDLQPSSFAANNSRAVDGYDAYFGKYRVDTEGVVTQELEGALSPADVGKIVTRRYSVVGAELVIEVETTSSDGQPVTRTLRWRRLA
jgi:hypothetical protein